MVMRDIGSFHYPETQPREINLGKGEWIMSVSRDHLTGPWLHVRFNKHGGINQALLATCCVYGWK